MFIIVKNAAKEVCNLFFDSDPQLGMHKSFSAHLTYSGKEANLKECYITKEAAEIDLKRINKMNPSGNYAICPLVSN